MARARVAIGGTESLRLLAEAVLPKLAEAPMFSIRALAAPLQVALQPGYLFVESVCQLGHVLQPVGQRAELWLLRRPPPRRHRPPPPIASNEQR